MAAVPVVVVVAQRTRDSPAERCAASHLQQCCLQHLVTPGLSGRVKASPLAGVGVRWTEAIVPAGTQPCDGKEQGTLWGVCRLQRSSCRDHGSRRLFLVKLEVQASPHLLQDGWLLASSASLTTRPTVLCPHHPTRTAQSASAQRVPRPSRNIPPSASCTRIQRPQSKPVSSVPCPNMAPRPTHPI